MYTENDIESAFIAGWLARECTGNNRYEERNTSCASYMSLHPYPLRVIFLDIDGVLNNTTDSEMHGDAGRSRYYSHRCVARLNDLTDSTHAKIVVSSTWRLGSSVEDLKTLLSSMGITGEVIDKTDRLSSDTFRGNEIHKWMIDNPELIGDYNLFKSYVILDDDSDMLLWHKNNYVNCDPEIGMTRRTVFKAISILRNAPCEDAGQEYA